MVFWLLVICWLWLCWVMFFYHYGCDYSEQKNKERKEMFIRMLQFLNDFTYSLLEILLTSHIDKIVYIWGDIFVCILVVVVGSIGALVNGPSFTLEMFYPQHEGNVLEISHWQPNSIHKWGRILTHELTLKVEALNPNYKISKGGKMAIGNVCIFVPDLDMKTSSYHKWVWIIEGLKSY